MTCDQEDPRRLHGGELALELGSDVEGRVERAVHRQGSGQESTWDQWAGAQRVIWNVVSEEGHWRII